MTDITHNSLQPMLKNDAKSFYGIFVTSFIVILAVAIVAQLLTWQWRPWFPGAESEKSMIGGVKSAVYTFMSHLN
jgi:light-harvesting complex 1 beta chain